MEDGDHISSGGRTLWTPNVHCELLKDCLQPHHVPDYSSFIANNLTEYEDYFHCFLFHFNLRKVCPKLYRIITF